ncbi:hypothetical protein HMPREF1550_00875, partial [Actinomyces sp. oral taxon 877 str. F0543]
ERASRPVADAEPHRASRIPLAARRRRCQRARGGRRSHWRAVPARPDGARGRALQWAHARRS